MEPLVLVANPGSASRKYALYSGIQLLGSLHFEWEADRAICTLRTGSNSQRVNPEIETLDEAVGKVLPIFSRAGLLSPERQITIAATRIVAPSSFFLADRMVTDEVIWQLEQAADKAPLHVGGALNEIKRLREALPGVPIAAISDSAFHVTKPDYAWNYGIDLAVADNNDIKRFGYHGLSVAAAAETLQSYLHAKRVIVCHLGSGNSVSAVLDGKSIDNTMGYSPLEGVTMGTRSGSIDPIAVAELRRILNLSEAEMLSYLNNHSGLLGVSGSSGDIRELLVKEAAGDYRAGLALRMYVHGIQKGIGQMSATLGGVDALVFTGTIGERSAILRTRILDNLEFLGFIIDKDANERAASLTELTAIQRWHASKPILIVPADEAKQISQNALLLQSN